MDFNIKKLVVLVALALAIGGSIAFVVNRSKSPSPSITSPAGTTGETGVTTPACAQDAFTKVIDEVSPGLVTVISSDDYEAIKDCDVGVVIGKEDDYVGKMEVSCTKPGADTALRTIKGGTGFIISADGWVVTSSVAVPDNKTRYLVTSDGKTFKADVSYVGKDEGISLLKSEASGHAWLKLGKSADVGVNKTLMAIGLIPGQKKVSSSVGVVKSVGGDFTVPLRSGYATFENLIETDMGFDTAVFSAPLFNEKGDVVGMNIGYSPVTGALFVPADRIQTIAQSVIKTGDWDAPYIGVWYNKVPEGFKITGKGAASVIPGSPADKGGLKEGDVIYQVGGVDATKIDFLGDAIRDKQTGDVVTFLVHRGGQSLDIHVKLEKSGLR